MKKLNSSEMNSFYSERKYGKLAAVSQYPRPPTHPPTHPRDNLPEPPSAV